MDCKEALVTAEGDMDKAVELLRKLGIAKAEKKVGRKADQGVVLSYVHPGNRIGVLVEVNCETDFVAKNQYKKVPESDSRTSGTFFFRILHIF